MESLAEHGFIPEDDVIELLELETWADWDALVAVAFWENVKLRKRYEESATAKERAKTAADYVRWFVEEENRKIVKNPEMR